MKISLVDRWSIVDQLVDDLCKHCRWYIFLVARYRNRTGRYGAQLFFLPRVLRYFSYFPTGDQSKVEQNFARESISSFEKYLRFAYRIASHFSNCYFKMGLQSTKCYLSNIYFQTQKKRENTYTRTYASIMEIVIKIRFKISTARTFLTKRIAFTIWIGS